MNEAQFESSETAVIFNPVDTVFDFSQSQYEIELDVSPNPERVKLTAAKMRRPTAPELIAREKESTFESRQVSATESERVEPETNPNARLFKKIVTEVKGYRLKSESKELSQQFREPSPELLSLIPSTHQSRFVESIYIADAKFSDDEDDVVLGGDVVLPVDLIIGYKEDPISIIRFELPEPPESRFDRFMRNSSSQREVGGSRKRHIKIVTNLRASIEFFVELITQSGASVSDNGLVNGVAFKDATDKRKWALGIDPIYMTLILNAAFSKYNAKRQD